MGRGAVFIIRLIFLIPMLLFAAPPREIPPDLFDEFTLGGIVPIYDWYIDGTYPKDKPLIFSRVDEWVVKAEAREVGYYGATDLYLYEMLEKYRARLVGKKVAIIGSTTPWYEAIVLAFGGHPTTIEYNPIVSEDIRIETLTVEEYEKTGRKFDIALSISSIEHDGLGRYGDPINPWGDMQAMGKIANMLEEGGLLFLAVPIGSDAIYWNAHRVYGSLRLPLLLQNWEIIDTAGYSTSDLHTLGYTGHQPVFVLCPVNKP